MLMGTTTFALIMMQAVSTPVERLSDIPDEAREGQWVHRLMLGDGTRQSTAVFLSWDYSSVIFTVVCDQQTKELVVRHSLDANWEAAGVPQVALGSAEQSEPLKTIQVGDVLEGRTRVTASLRTLLAGSAELQIDAPNEMDEPYYVGQAKPLRDVALACR